MIVFSVLAQELKAQLIFAPAQLLDRIRFHRGESQLVLPDLAQEIIRQVLSDKP